MIPYLGRFGMWAWVNGLSSDIRGGAHHTLTHAPPSTALAVTIARNSDGRYGVTLSAPDVVAQTSHGTFGTFAAACEYAQAWHDECITVKHGAQQ